MVDGATVTNGYRGGAILSGRETKGTGEESGGTGSPDKQGLSYQMTRGGGRVRHTSSPFRFIVLHLHLIGYF